VFCFFPHSSTNELIGYTQYKVIRYGFYSEMGIYETKSKIKEGKEKEKHVKKE
jgi:hypothetical protein